MPAGGVLTFRAEACRELPSKIRGELEIAPGNEAPFVRLAIVDSGIGMPDEVKERAFEPFFTTKASGRGTGLGLSTVYGFVKQSRGAIEIESAPGEGTTISLYLPSPAADGAPSASVAPARAAVRPGLRVLLVEDDAEVRSVVKTFLQHLACHVTLASNAEDALILLGPDAAFDVLLTDIALGAGMRGTELASEAQRRFPKLGVVLMSGFSAELIDADRDAPASWELLRKPYSREELANAIAIITAGAG